MSDTAVNSIADSAALLGQARNLVAELGRLIAELKATPPKSADDLIAEAINRLALDGCRSSIMQLDRPLLIELCRRLVKGDAPIGDVAAWLDAQTGRPMAKSVYRFVQPLRDAFRLAAGLDKARRTDAGSADPAAAAPPASTEAIVAALATLRGRGLSNNLLDLPDATLVEAFRQVGEVGIGGTKALSWLRSQTDRPVNPNAVNWLIRGIKRELRAVRDT